MLQVSIGLSIVLGFLSSELLGLTAGGLVTAGYLAFYLEQPYRLLTTLLLAMATFLVTKLLTRFIILYGRRRFLVTVLISLLGTWFFEKTFYYINAIPQDLRIIGYVIPGLLANDMLRQGVAKTVGMAVLIALIIRLILMTGLLA